jgi:hypothetical protein
MDEFFSFIGEIVFKIGESLFKLFSALGGEKTFCGIFGDGYYKSCKKAGWIIIAVTVFLLVEEVKKRDKS